MPFFRYAWESPRDVGKRLVYWVKYPVKLWGYGWLDALVMGLIPARPGKRLLLFRCDLIGDYLLTRPFFPLFKQDPRWKDWSIHFAGNALVQDLVLHRDLEPLDEWIPIDRKRFINSLGYRFRVLCRIRRAGFGVVVNLSHTRQYWLESVVRVSGAPERITGEAVGQYMAPWETDLSQRLYSRIEKTGGPVEFEFYRNRLLFSALCEGADRVEMGPPHREIPPRNPESPLRIALAPGASSGLRQWPAERFARLIADVLQHHPATFWLLGATSDRAMADDIQRLSGQVPVENRCGLRSLTETLADLEDVDLLISNESAPVHMAAALGVQCICLSQGNHFGRWNPWPAELAPRVETVYPARFGDVSGHYTELAARYHDRSLVPMSELEYQTVWAAVKRTLDAMA